jgi:hypothetical protein
VRLRGSVRVNDDLGEAVAVAQVEEDEMAVVASTVDPAGQSGRVAGVRGTELATRVGAVRRGERGRAGVRDSDGHGTGGSFRRLAVAGLGGSFRRLGVAGLGGLSRRTRVARFGGPFGRALGAGLAGRHGPRIVPAGARSDVS